MKKPGWPYRLVRQSYLFLLDRFTRKQGMNIHVNDFKFRVPGRYSRYYPRDYEKANFEFMRARFIPGMIGIDVGAHIGIYSIRMMQLGAASVFAFEPTPATAEVLKKVIHLNHFEERILTRSEAVGNQAGKADFYLNAPTDDRDKMNVSEANSLKHIDHGNMVVKKTQTVKVISLDEFLSSKKIDKLFLKIDAEGSELDILTGAINIFKQAKPIGIISIHSFTYNNRETELRKLWELFQELSIDPRFENRSIDRAGLLDLGNMDIFDLQFTTIDS